MVNRSQRHRLFLSAACLLPLAVCLLFTQRRVDSPNVSSRMDTIQSLVERGTFCIDGSLNRFMVDVVKIDGRFYSDKPPLLSVLGAGVYWPLHRVFGLSFERHAPWLYYFLTVVFVGVPMAVGLWLFGRCLSLADLRPRTVACTVFLTGAGTLFLPYSVTFINHVPAAAAVIAALYCLLRSDAGDPRSLRWAVAAGGFAALAFNLDLAPGGMVLLGFGALALTRGNRISRALAYGAGAAIPMALYVFLNFLVTHDLRPIYLHPEYYEYEGSALRSYDALKMVYGKSVVVQVFHMLFGYRGFFLYSPILLFGLSEIARRIARKESYRGLGVFSIAAALVVAAAYAAQTGGMAGGSYGMRWLLPLTPLFAFFMALWIDRAASRKGRIAFQAAVAFSVAVAAIGVPRPWSSNIRSPFTFLDNVAWFTQTLRPPAGRLAYWIVDSTSLEKDYAYFEIGRWHMNHGYFLAAVSDLESARSLVDPERARALEPSGTLPDYFSLIDYFLGQCYGETGNPDRAVAAYERVLKREPRNTGAWNNYAVSLIGMNLPNQALAAYKRSLEIDPNKVFTHQSVARLYLRLGLSKQAETHWKHALELQPDNVGTLLGIGSMYLETGRPDEGLRHWERAAELAPANVDLRARLAKAWWQHGNRAKALEHLRAVEALRPDDPRIRLAIRQLLTEGEPTTPLPR